jgi:hypothetical protein
MGLERGPLSFVRIIEGLIERKISGSSEENSVRWVRQQPRSIVGTTYPAAAVAQWV